MIGQYGSFLTPARTATTLRAMNSDRSNLGLGCLVVFLLPFFAVGIGTGAMALVHLAGGRWTDAGLFAIFAVSFGGMASFFLGAALRGKRRADRVARLRAARPEAPWTWRPDWADGRIESGSRKRLAFVLFFALLWNAIAMPAPFFAWPAITEQGERAALLVFVFPLVGLFLVVWAVRELIRHRKFGVPVLELASTPGVIGHGISGEVCVSAPLEPYGGFAAKLVCVRRVTTGSGKNRSTSERILWQEERQVTDGRREYNRTLIPVSFPIPADALDSDDSNPNNQIVWRIEVGADVPGVDFAAGFEVPVFRTAASDLPTAATGDGSSQAAPPDEECRQPQDSRIVVSKKPRGTEVYFPPARNTGAAIGLTAFTLIWSGVIWMLVVLDAPLLFPVVFGAFDALLLYGVLTMWFGMTRLELSPDTATVTSGLSFAARTRRIHPELIADFKLEIGMQSGNTPYYRIMILGEDGSKVAAGRGIRDKREAEWLVDIMKEAIQRDG